MNPPLGILRELKGLFLSFFGPTATIVLERFGTIGIGWHFLLKRIGWSKEVGGCLSGFYLQTLVKAKRRARHLG